MENMNDIIIKKRDGQPLTKKEIEYFISGYSFGDIPDYQVAALLMAIFFQHLTREEIYDLTYAMVKSGETIDLSSIEGIKVDKHSTGGVGDKTTLIVVPLAAACQVPIAKMSGRGLGFTGGTIDKLESIPGMQTSFSRDEFFAMVNNTNLAVIGQTGAIAKADKLLYALRDVTGTVDSLGLIASSIMSKKLAAGSDAILLDVKCGIGAFMEEEEKAKKLGQTMVDLGKDSGKETMAMITDMSQPLGRYVGNSLEVFDAIETLKGKGLSDIETLSIELAGAMIFLGKKAKSIDEGKEKAREALRSGAGLEKLREMILSQGGDGRVIDDEKLLLQGRFQRQILSDNEGYVKELNPRKIGVLAQHLGAGRERKEDVIDFSAGIKLEKKVGDYVSKGETLAILYGSKEEKVDAGVGECKEAYSFSKGKPEKRPMIIQVIT